MNDKKAKEINRKYALRQMELAIEELFYSDVRKHFTDAVEELRNLNVSDTKICELFKTTWFNLEKESEK